MIEFAQLLLLTSFGMVIIGMIIWIYKNRKSLKENMF